MESIFSYVSSPDEDYYAILGCAPDSTVDQILAEYKVRARELHPDKNVEEPSATTDKFQRLQLAKEILVDPGKRADYDKWRNCGLSVSYKDWKALKGKTHAGMHWAPPKSFKPMLEDSENKVASDVAGASASQQPGRPNESRGSSVPFAWTRDERSRKFQNFEF